MSLYQFSAERHRDVRIKPGVDIAAAARVNHEKVGLSEISTAAADYPLGFLKDNDTGQFKLVALFGLFPATNAFLINDGWQATYLPLAVLAAPFCLGGADHVLCINEGSAHVTTDTGDALFLADEGEAPALVNIRAKLDYLRSDLAAAETFVATLQGLDLIRPISVISQFDSGPDETIDGFYSVSPPKLAVLAGDAILDLHQRNLLGAVYAIVQSLAQMNRLQQLHNLSSNRPITAIRMEMAAR